MSKSIYVPYFYIIQHINSGKFYAGVRYGKNAEPDQLLQSNGYQTSSNIVKQIILEEGLESFVIRKIKVFDTGEQALEYESRFLRKVNAAFNDSFLNKSNNSMSTLNVDWEKLKNTNVFRYGFEYAGQVPEFQEKRKQTCLNNFGVEFSLQSEEVRNKSKETILKRYGVTNISQNEEIKEIKKQTMIQNFGVPYALQSEELSEKYKQTVMNNFNVEYPMQSETVRETLKQNNLAKYGVINVFQTESVKEKIKQTNLVNLGVENPMQSEEVKEKSKQTLLRNFGVENPSQIPEIQEKKRQTRVRMMNRPIVLEIRKYKEKFNPKLIHYWFCKPQEVLDGILEELKLTYGELE